MAVERRVFKSVSESSMFKFLLFFYLLFFLFSIIVMSIIGLIAWMGLSFSGIDIKSIFDVFGLGNLAIFSFFGGGGIITILVLIVGGLVASVFYAAVGTIMVWIVNVVLRISGGIELRFLPEKKEEVKASE
jgi:hypothetical protein